MGTAVRTNAAPAWHRRRVRIYDREAPLGYLLLVPTLLVLGVFLLYPFLFGIWLSITDSELGNLGSFIGLGNYRFEFRNTDGVFYTAVVNTFLYTGITTVFKLSLGLVMALLLNQAFPFRRFVRAALLLPYIIPTVLSYEAWRWMFDPTFSVINWLLVNTHLVAYPGPNWLGVPFNAMAALMIVNVWRGTPFYAIAFLAGMQVIPLDLYEAARVDGATRWQQFTNITVPMLRPVLLVVLLLSTILTFADFQGPFVLTNGAPYNSTQLLSIWSYQWGRRGGEDSQARNRPRHRRQVCRARAPHLPSIARHVGCDAVPVLLDGGHVVQVGLRAVRFFGQPTVGTRAHPGLVPAPPHSDQLPALGVQHGAGGDGIHPDFALLQHPGGLLARASALSGRRHDRLGNLCHLPCPPDAPLPAADLRHQGAAPVQQPLGADPHVPHFPDSLLHLDADGLLQRHTARARRGCARGWRHPHPGHGAHRHSSGPPGHPGRRAVRFHPFVERVSLRADLHERQPGQDHPGRGHAGAHPW